MLKNKAKTIVLSADTFIGEERVLGFSATIPSTTGVGTISQYTYNAELYAANKAAIRSDQTEFQASVWAAEDAMIVEFPEVLDQTQV